MPLPPPPTSQGACQPNHSPWLDEDDEPETPRHTEKDLADFAFLLQSITAIHHDLFAENQALRELMGPPRDPEECPNSPRDGFCSSRPPLSWQLQGGRSSFESIDTRESERGASPEPPDTRLNPSASEGRFRVSFALHTANTCYNLPQRRVQSSGNVSSLSVEQRAHQKKQADLKRKYEKLLHKCPVVERLPGEIDGMLEIFASRRKLKKNSEPSALTCADVVRAQMAATNDESEDDSLTLFRFVKMLTEDESDFLLTPEEQAKLLEIRGMFAEADLTEIVAKLSHAHPEDLRQVNKLESMWTMQRLLDPISFMLIVVNAVLLGVSTDIDPDSKTWEVIEYMFAAFFSGEMAVKMCTHGVGEFFFGIDWQWNVADLLFVFLAVLDALLTGLVDSSDSNLQFFTLMRLVRVARVTRLIRLLRFSFFKELLLMIRGVMAGLRILLWAIILLVCIVFCFGMLLRQTIGQWCNMAVMGDDVFCPNQHLQQHNEALFSTVGRSCFTVFRCFTEGCASVDGTPLMTHMFENGGSSTSLVMTYLLTYIIVTFGLFNLIAAVFVETTMEAAKHDERRRQQLRRTEHLHVARRLQQFVVQFCKATAPDEPKEKFSWTRRLWFLKTKSSVRKEMPLNASHTDPISRAVFAKVIATPEMKDLLEDIDVNVSDPLILFDTLDADGDGSLDVAELVKGIMRLRGPADKGDVVASLLTVRETHARLKQFEAKVLQNHKYLDAKIGLIEDAVLEIQKPYHNTF